MDSVLIDNRSSKGWNISSSCRISAATAHNNEGRPRMQEFRGQVAKVCRIDFSKLYIVQQWQYICAASLVYALQFVTTQMEKQRIRCCCEPVVRWRKQTLSSRIVRHQERAAKKAHGTSFLDQRQRHPALY